MLPLLVVCSMIWAMFFSLVYAGLYAGLSFVGGILQRYYHQPECLLAKRFQHTIRQRERWARLVHALTKLYL